MVINYKGKRIRTSEVDPNEYEPFQWIRPCYWLVSIDGHTPNYHFNSEQEAIDYAKEVIDNN